MHEAEVKSSVVAAKVSVIWGQQKVLSKGMRVMRASQKSASP